MENKNWVEEFRDENDYNRLSEHLARDGLRFIQMSKYLQQPPFQKKLSEPKTSIRDVIFEWKKYRIFLGIGTEFLLKAAYLKAGYHIHEYELPRLKKRSETNTMLKQSDRTISFDFMIENLGKVLPDESNSDMKKIKEGLKVIMRWRNDEMHYTKSFKKEDSEEIELARYAVHQIKEILV